MKVRIYIEGGGDGLRLDSIFREAWMRFFEKAGLQGSMPATIRGKGREHTFDLFRTAVQCKREEEINILLVDSEELVSPQHSAWQHLKARDNWDPPSGAKQEDAFLMVCSMETWLIADRAALQSFFPGLRDKHLPKWSNLESKRKQDVFAALDRATAGCKRPYRKGAVSFELLAELDPKEVEKHCPAAARLLGRLRHLLS